MDVPRHTGRRLAETEDQLITRMLGHPTFPAPLRGLWYSPALPGPPVPQPSRFRDATNTGLARLGITETDLAEYTGPGGYDRGGPYLIEDQVIGVDIRLYNSVQMTIRRCKILAHIDVDSVDAALTLEDSHVDAGPWSNAAIGFQNLTILRCNVQGGITAVNGSYNVVVQDSYLHGQVISAAGSDHAGGFLCSGGGNIELRGSTIWCSVQDNGHGGGPSNNLNLFGDLGPLRNIRVKGCYFPATAGGYSVSLGHNPGKPYGDNPAGIVFVDNVLGRDLQTGRGGAYGTVTSFLASEPSNLYAGNVWADNGQPVPVNT
ncbi:hypothetical protein SAMN04489716_6946 [Actinoplanes derwentensis]|uniref:Right handed beta helix region n=2 Tax=Actinoplanes derwentensis TaxID=113562 RepID=A0A1H2CV35_9ACTN|nr:hypothetical protein Ade03nite_09240 [Actinoplanes derwentensis]SDT74321.1 hypothetical protein SAMN04489716_6946 [Actinoplanes derwentensis]